MIEDVEEIHAELDVVVVAELPIFGELHIKVPGAGAMAPSPACCAHGAQLVADQSERVWIEDLIPVLARVAVNACSIRAFIIAEARARQRAKLIAIRESCSTARTSPWNLHRINRVIQVTCSVSEDAQRRAR